MLYVSTRSKTDVHTCNHALTKHTSPDGGLYVPFRLPLLSQDDLENLAQKSFSDNVCHILKLLLGTDLKSWDVDFLIGRNPVRLIPLSHKIIAGETWRNPDWVFSRMVCSIVAKIRASELHSVQVTSWSQIAVRISVLFGLFSQLRQTGFSAAAIGMDVAVEGENLSAAISAIYARRMGLPVGNIVCSCSANSALWELLHTGQLLNREHNRIQEDMERLIYEVLGQNAAIQYVDCMTKGLAFQLTQQQRDLLREEISAVVVSPNRMGSIIPNVYRTCSYILSPEAALAYGGLLDHRSRSGERRAALLLTESSPLCEADTVARCMNLSAAELKDIIFSK